MQEALFREDASLREVTNISFKSSLELRAIFFPPRIHELNAEEIAAELFRCRASSLYLEALGLTIDHGSNYVSQYFRADYIKMRKYIQYCEDMLNNHEYLWDAKDLFASYLLQENDAYNPDAELIQAMHKLQNQIKQLILNAITDSWIIASLLKVIANIDELVFAISKVNPEHELLNTENLLPYIHSLPDLISILKRIDNFDRQYQIVSACEVLLPENICQNITTIEQLKSLLSVISPVNRKTRTLIYNAYPTTDLVKLAKTAANFNELLLSFSSDCRNHLLKRNAVYCAKLIMNDDDLYLLLDKLQINHLTNLLYHIPLDIKICLLKDLNALSKVLTLVDSKISAYLLKLLPSITRLQSLHNATEREKLIFFRSVVPRGLQILFSSLSANEWYTLFPDTSLLLDLIAKLELSKQAFVDCIPKSVKLRIYQETNSHRENIQTSTKNIFHDFNDLKLLINKLINPPSAYSYLCFWKTKQKVYPNIHSISDLQILIIDNYLINPTMFNLSSAQRICEEYRARVPQTNQANIISNIKIL